MSFRAKFLAPVCDLNRAGQVVIGVSVFVFVSFVAVSWWNYFVN